MKKNILLVVFIGSLFACSSPTQIVNSWKDPNTSIQNPQLHRIVVAALLYDQGVRRQVEDYMVTLYPGRAVQSYLIFGTDSLVSGNEAIYNQRLKDQGYDGIVIMRQVNMNVSQHYVPGTFPTYYHTWGGYWGGGWGSTWVNPGTPGYVQTDRNWNVQVNAYSVDADKLVWSANTRTTDPGGRLPLFEDVCNRVRKEMKNDGFLK